MFSLVLYHLIEMIPFLLKQEHILETQDKAEVDRVSANVEECRKTLLNLGHAEFTFEDFFAVNLFFH